MGSPQNYVSISRRPLDIEDYIDMLRRHRSWIIGPMFAGLVIAVVAAFLWPDTYESKAIMRITPQRISEQLVPSTVVLQLSERINNLRTWILSRTNLTNIIQKEDFNLYPRLRQRLTMEDAIAQMVKDVAITPFEFGSSGASDRRYMTAFEIRFSYSDRIKAQKVVQELVSQFTSQNISVQRTSATATAGFLGDQLKEAKTRLDELTRQIAEFRGKNPGRLRDDSLYNTQILSSLQMQLGQVNEKLNRVQQAKNSLQTELQSRLDMQALIEQGAADESAGTPAQLVKNSNLINLNAKLRDAEALLAAQREVYTDKHQVIRSLEAQVRALKSQLESEQRKQDAEEQAAAAQVTQPKKSLTLGQRATLANLKGTVETIKTNLQNNDLELRQATADRASIERQIEAVRARIESSPMVDQKYSELTRDSQTAKEHYEELVKKQQIAETATNLEERNAGEQLELLDPATLPQSPTYPNRYLIAGIGTGIGLMIGLVLAGAKEAKDASLKNLKDVRAYTSLPILSSIPLLENALLVRRKRRIFWLAWSTAVIAGTLAMSGSMYYYFSLRGQ
jgi:polysaccharide biosynthesis transport protein